MVVARRWADGSSLAALAAHPRVHWRESVSDEELRQLYQRAWLLVLPLRESSANNAVVEALACGTMPVVNYVGGIPDYGGGTIYPTVDTGSDESFLALIACLLESPVALRGFGRLGRNFATAHLDWRQIRRQHAELYRRFSSSSGE